MQHYDRRDRPARAERRPLSANSARMCPPLIALRAAARAAPAASAMFSRVPVCGGIAMGSRPLLHGSSCAAWRAVGERLNDGLQRCHSGRRHTAPPYPYCGSASGQGCRAPEDNAMAFSACWRLMPLHLVRDAIIRLFDTAQNALRRGPCFAVPCDGDRPRMVDQIEQFIEMDADCLNKRLVYGSRCKVCSEDVVQTGAVMRG